MLTHAGRRRCICTISSVEVLAVDYLGGDIKDDNKAMALSWCVCSVGYRVWVEAVEAAVQLI
jgi:hypothetical protein